MKSHSEFRKLVPALIILLLSTPVLAQNDEQQVKQVVTTAYIQGIHNGGPVADIRAGFHPTFNMLGLMDNQVKPLPIEEWISNIEKTRAQQTAQPQKTEGIFVSVAVAGNAANVVLDLYRADKKIFADNLLLYKFTEGWRIVSKTYYRHP
jgi:hypothetical protein